MPREKLTDIKIPTLDEDVFESDEKKALDNAEKVIEIKINKIKDFPNHPFHVKEDEEMTDLIESVDKVGILTPVIVRPKEDGTYEMVAGHRRKYACVRNEKSTIPALVRNLSDDEATIIMVDTNLRQRQHILPSEKAFAYKMKLDAMKRQGERTDLTSRPLGKKLYSVDELSKEVEDSARQIHRLIRLCYLNDNILNLVDNNRIGLRPAVEISYLSNDAQQKLLYYMQLNECTPSHEQAIRIRKCFNEHQLTDEYIKEIMEEEKPNQVEKLKITKNRIQKFFKPQTSIKEMENEIVKALEYYQNFKNRMKDRGAR